MGEISRCTEMHKKRTHLSAIIACMQLLAIQPHAKKLQVINCIVKVAGILRIMTNLTSQPLIIL